MLGSSGSAITVPLLNYLVGHGTKESIAESMAIVGLISIFAAIPNAKSKQLDWRSVWYFGIPGMLGTLVGAWFGGMAAEALQLVVFGIVVAAAFAMLKNSTDEGETDRPIWLIAVQGMFVGLLTGFVGVGGGFLIVPALVLLGKLPMRLAIGTSLVIIVFNAMVGFAKYENYLASNNMSVNAQATLVFTAIGIAGSTLGRSINSRLNQEVLRHIFAGFLVVLGTFVMLREGGKLFVGDRNLVGWALPKEPQSVLVGDAHPTHQAVEFQTVERPPASEPRGERNATQVFYDQAVAHASYMVGC